MTPNAASSLSRMRQEVRMYSRSFSITGRPS
jgi:hypothetical protein